VAWSTAFAPADDQRHCRSNPAGFAQVTPLTPLLAVSRSYPIYDRDGPLSVLPLALGAMEVGTAASGAKTAGDLEVAQVSHEARAASAIVFTYDPDRYAGHRLDVVDLRP
jgi:hypothetical protein